MKPIFAALLLFLPCFFPGSSLVAQEDAQKAVLITGASSDIGIELIKKVHQKNDSIIAIYHNNNSALEELQSEGIENITSYKCDLSSFEDI